MFDKLKNLQSRSHSPHSEFKVSAILINKNGDHHLGVNVEDASYGGTICAERSALVSAISNGEKPENFKEIHVLCGENSTCKPCGICRQFFSNYVDKDFKFFLYSNEGKTEILTMEQLLPYSFDKENA